MTPVYLALAAVVPPFDDELYYWCWSRDLQLSYYDHPPMVAYMIRGATELFGSSIFTIRLPAVLSAIVVAGVIGWLSRPRDLLPMIVLSPVLTIAAVMVTPDTPMLMFWALYLAWLVAVHERLDSRVSAWVWILGGVLLGCGVLGKYTMALAALAGGVSFLVAGNPRRWVSGYTIHTAVAIVVASPILIHNIRHDFIPILYQWGHSMSSPAPGIKYFAEFVGIQILLLGTLPFFVFVWALAKRRELFTDPRLRVCFCLFVLPFAFFLLKASRGRIEGNWAFPVYLACWPLVAEWYRGVRESARWRWATRAGFAVPLGVSVVFLVHLWQPLPLLPAKNDRITRQHTRMAVGEAVAADLAAMGYAGPVATPTYQWTAILRWHGVDARQMEGVSRPSHFTRSGLATTTPTRDLLFLVAPSVEACVPQFGKPRFVLSYPFRVRELEYEPCWLLGFSDRAADPRQSLAPVATGHLDPAPSHPRR
jgi:4-amino-4-deoxy-L-arabinose transferase-like glycosyltransferase